MRLRAMGQFVKGDPAAWRPWAGGPRAYARILVGPTGTANPGPGRWRIWTRITDNPETPVLDSGMLLIG